MNRQAKKCDSAHRLQHSIVGCRPPMALSCSGATARTATFMERTGGVCLTTQVCDMQPSVGQQGSGR
jgi:hypothetical protein